MAIVKSDTPKLLLPGLQTIFMQEFNKPGEILWQNVATEVPSGKDSETYGWLGSVPKMREFKDERIPQGLLEHSYSITNKTWESSIAVNRAELEDDQYGQIKLRVQSLAEEARRHQEELIFGLIGSGFTTTCYDSQYFFDTDHSEGDSGTQSNKGTTALGAGSLQTAITSMMNFKDDKGKPMGIVPDTLCVGPSLKFTAMELLESVYNVDVTTANVSGKANVLKGALKLIVSPYLTDTNDWFVLCTNRIVKPIIFQSRIPVEFGALEAQSENGFMRDEYVYGVRARYNVGYGLWQYAYGASV